MHDLVPCHNSKRTRACLECNEMPVLKWPGNSPEINSIENVWNIMKILVSNCVFKKRRYGSQFVKRGIV